MCSLVFHFGVHLYFPSLVNGSLRFQGLKSVLSWGILVFLNWIYFSCFVPCPYQSEAGFPLVFILGGVCSGPATEVTSEVRAPELFLSACLSWLVATLVFGSLESLSVTASMTAFYLLDQPSHFIYKLGNHLRFCGCACFTHVRASFFWLLGYFFLSLLHILSVSTISSYFWVGDILSLL